MITLNIKPESKWVSQIYLEEHHYSTGLDMWTIDNDNNLTREETNNNKRLFGAHRKMKVSTLRSTEKQTNTDQYLVFDFHHPLENKLSVIKTLHHQGKHIPTKKTGREKNNRTTSKRFSRPVDILAQPTNNHHTTEQMQKHCHSIHCWNIWEFLQKQYPCACENFTNSDRGCFIQEKKKNTNTNRARWWMQFSPESNI